MPEVPVVSVPDFVPDSVPASVRASVCVVCVFVVSAASFPLHAVSNNAALSVKTGINIFLVFINHVSLINSIKLLITGC